MEKTKQSYFPARPEKASDLVFDPESAFAAFEDGLQRVLSVPKAKIDKGMRTKEYRKFATRRGRRPKVSAPASSSSS